MEHNPRRGRSGLPDYQGGRDYRAGLVPLFLVNYDDLFFLGPFGVGMNAINRNGFRAGPVFSFEGGRRQSDDPHLNGLGDISPSLTGGAFAAYRFGPFEISGTAQQAVTHTRNGLTGLVQFEYRAQIIPGKLDLIVGPHLEFADAHYDRVWFGVPSSQSMQSGLPVYTPGATVKDVGLHGSLTYHFSEHILLHTFASIKEFAGDIANSPIVASKSQGLIGLGGAYRF